ncbi:MAG: DUF58 domain-containing protein [Chloroflexi bacterium]|nr:DUF58 domain-containing protein [Chloroflexota bacterium]MBI5349839.1 DUF58 domain-containing protein [Chloroflexota bacterium]
MPQSSPDKILKRLDWTVIRRLEGVLQGNYRTLFLGNGLDLADLREYQIGDDIRHIDWNVSARMNTPYVRQYLEDREITAWFLLDLSPSVDFGTVNTLKRNMLVDFVTTLARLLTRNGNRVGAVLYNGIEDRVIPAGGGKMQVLHLINELVRQPKLLRTPPTNLTKLLETAHRAIKRRSLIFIVSDFFSEPGWEKPLMLLNRRHEVLAVRLSDPRESDLPDMGWVILEDSESGEQLHLNSGDRKFRKRFDEAVKKREYELSVKFRMANVDTLPLSTEDDLLKSLIRFATTRKMRKRSK